MTGSSPTRRAAWIATSITMPMVVIAAFAIAHARQPAEATSSTSLSSPVKISASTPDDTTAAQCTKLLEQLPVSLDTLTPRIVHADSPFALAFGQPPVELLCGVERPKALVPNADLVRINDVDWLETGSRSTNTYIAVDRSVYIRLEVPTSLSTNPVPTISTSISAALDRVCQSQGFTTTDVYSSNELCTNRPPQ